MVGAMVGCPAPRLTLNTTSTSRLVSWYHVHETVRLVCKPLHRFTNGQLDLEVACTGKWLFFEVF